MMKVVLDYDEVAGALRTPEPDGAYIATFYGLENCKLTLEPGGLEVLPLARREPLTVQAVQLLKAAGLSVDDIRFLYEAGVV